MKHENIKQLWIDINNKYPRLFKNNEGKWFDYLKDLDEYIQTYNKLPMENDNDKSISTLANWVADQRYRYKKHLENARPAAPNMQQWTYAAGTAIKNERISKWQQLQSS
jgi:hypothetical protein